MPAGQGCIHRRSLMGEEALDALGAQAGLQVRVQRRIQHAELGRAARHLLQVDDLPLVERLAAELGEKGGDVHTVEESP